MKSAAHIVTLHLDQHKTGGHPMECRGMLAEYDEAQDVLTVWDGTQMPHRAREIIVKTLRWSEERVRVICPDVGGGFGPKFVIYSEEIVVPLAAVLLRRPVKWIEDRREHFTATTMERDQAWTVRAAAGARRPLARPRHRDDPRPRRGDPARHQRAAELRHQRARPLSPARLPLHSLGRAHQQDAGNADARRGPAAGHLRDGARARRHRRQALPRPRRGAPPQSHRPRRNALRHAAAHPRRRHHDLRQRRLPRRPGARARQRRLRRLSRTPGRRPRSGPHDRFRSRQLRRRLRPRPVRKRARAHRPNRPRDGRDRRHRAGPGHRRPRWRRSPPTRWTRRSSIFASSPATPPRRPLGSARLRADRPRSAARPCIRQRRRCATRRSRPLPRSWIARPRTSRSSPACSAPAASLPAV